jgi:hypothetical protein
MRDALMRNQEHTHQSIRESPDTDLTNIRKSNALLIFVFLELSPAAARLPVLSLSLCGWLATHD